MQIPINTDHYIESTLERAARVEKSRDRRCIAGGIRSGFTLLTAANEDRDFVQGVARKDACKAARTVLRDGYRIARGEFACVLRAEAADCRVSGYGSEF